MKKYLFLVAVAFVATSCRVTTKSSRTESMPYAMYNASVADLEVGNRITYTMTPTKPVNRGGVANVKKAAIQEALSQNGNADLLVEPMFVVAQKKLLFRTKVSSVTVSGRPAKYKNFRSLNDSVWTDPIFRNTRNTSIHIFKNAPKEWYK